MTLEEMQAWVDEDDEAEAERDVQFHIVQGAPFTAKGIWRKKRMRASRPPLYVKPHDERHLWLMAH
jgi:hypothetical protein